MKKIEIEEKKEIFNPVYLPYLFDYDTKRLIFYGGAGSGKSYFIAERFILKLLKVPGCNVLVVRQVGDTNRNSTFALFKQVIDRWGMGKYFRFNVGNLSVKCRLNGNEVIFKGLDNIEKLKSITFATGELTDVWIEEASETEEVSLNQLITRLRGGKSKKQIVISFNPISVNHWLKRRFFDTRQPKKKVKILHTTYKDNLFIDSDYKEELESFKETDPYYYQVYCLGEWGVLGKSIFPKEKVQERINLRIMPLAHGYFDYDYDGLSIRNIKFKESEDGFIKIYRFPEKGMNYVLGGDTAGEGSDRFTGQVIDRFGYQAAVLLKEFDEGEYTRQIYCLGKYYNNALCAIETNFSTFPVRELDRLLYKNLFVRMREDTYTKKTVKSFGFQTNSLTRPVIISKLVEKMRFNSDTVSDLDTLYEMQTFVRNEKGRPEAEQGSHDDLIMGLAIAEYAREQLSVLEPAAEAKKAKWTDDMYEDYYNAVSEEERKEIIKRYGNPF